jgi:O-antigen ligase
VTAERLRTAIRAALYALVLLAPLPFGSVQPGFVLAIELAAAAIGVLSMTLLAVDAEAREALPRAPLVLCGVVLLLGAFQILPLPFTIAERFNPTAGLVRPLIPYLGADHPPAVAWSVAPPETADALLRFGAYVWIGLGAALVFDTARARRGFAIVLVASAAFQAVYGSGEYLTGRQHIFTFAKKYYLDSATGTFINRNHFATFLAMALPFALGLAIPASSDSKGATTWRGRLLSFADAVSLRRFLAGVAAGLIWVGLLLSHSRAGLLAAFVAALIVLVGRRDLRAARWSVAVAGVVLIGLLSLELTQAPGERFLWVRQDLGTEGGRLTVWHDSLKLVEQRPLLGWGWGTFESAFPSVQSAGVDLTYDHAHNDWLEWLVEGGVLGLAVGGVLLGAGLRVGGVVVTAALTAVAIHAAWDFSLRIPAVATVCAATMGLGLAAPDSFAGVLIERRRFRKMAR